MHPDVAAMFSPQPGLCYLDSATVGLPPQATIDAMSTALAQWQDGSVNWIEHWDRRADDARTSFAELLSVPIGDVALIPAASVGVGTVASALGPADRVLVPDDEFTSVLFPLLVAQEQGVSVDQVPFTELADRIEPSTTLVATSLVQMQTGRVVDLRSVLDRAHEVGARVLVDATQGVPFAGMGGILGDADYVVCAAYKHLLSPRGVGFLIVAAEHQTALPAWNANWRAADEPYSRFSGGPLTLAPGAAQFDVSVAWFSWVGAAVSLDLLRQWRRADQLQGPLDLARELAERLGVQWGGASIVCAPVADADATQSALQAAGIKAGFRGDGVRFSTHVYNTPADIDHAVAVLSPLVSA